MEEMQQEQETQLSILFQAKKNLYCVDSRIIETIMQMPQCDFLPGAPSCVIGIFRYRDQALQAVDLRSVLGEPTLQREYEDFAQMLKDRKQDHVNWVLELERCMDTGERFKLTTDPHQCAFGKWYDSFTSDNMQLMHLLRKIDEPHRKLHHAAEEAMACQRDCANCQRSECLQKILEQVKKNYESQVLSLLDRAVELFKSTVFREMALVLRGKYPAALIVDEVLSVEVLEPISQQYAMPNVRRASYVEGVYKSQKREGMILKLDLEKMLEDLLQDSLDPDGFTPEGL